MTQSAPARLTGVSRQTLLSRASVTHNDIVITNY